MRWLATAWILLAAAAAAQAAEWRPAKVIAASYRNDAPLVGGMAPAGGAGGQVARGQFEFESEGRILLAEEQVTPRARLALEPGMAVEIAVEKKNLLLKMPDGKARRMRLISSEPVAGIRLSPAGTEWKKGSLIRLHYIFDGRAGVAAAEDGLRGSASGMVQTARGEIEIESEGKVHTATEVVAPMAMLRLQEGEAVEFVIDGRILLLKMADGKVRKLQYQGDFRKLEPRLAPK